MTSLYIVICSVFKNVLSILYFMCHINVLIFMSELMYAYMIWNACVLFFIKTSSVFVVDIGIHCSID